MTAGLVGALLFWIVAAGIPVDKSMIVVGVIAALCAWGQIIIRLLGAKLTDGVVGKWSALWLFGPALGLGAMALFLLRLVVSRSAFLTIFVVLPLSWVLLTAVKMTRNKSWKSDLGSGLRGASFSFLLFIGLVGITLMGRWAWAGPTVLAALASVFFVSWFRIRSSSFLFGLAAGLCVLTRQVNQGRPISWWKAAEGIPFDETILEAISNGLVQWGPTISPTHHSLNGVGAAAYHHLLYLVVGLVNYFATPGPYVALSIAGPVFTGLGIVCSLLLLTQLLLRNTSRDTGIPVVVLLSLVACLLGLSVGSLGSPSVWLGVGSVLAAMLIVTLASLIKPSWRVLGLVSFSVLTVAFSKGAFVYAPVLTAGSLTLFNMRRRWKVAAVTLLIAGAITGWFSWASVAVNSFYFEFWPYRNMSGDFGFDFPTFLRFFRILVQPVLFGFVCLVLLCFNRRPIIRELSYSLLIVMLVAMVSQLFITSTGPRSFELFYLPGTIAAPLLLLLLGTAQSASLTSPWKVAAAISVALSLVAFAPRVGNGRTSTDASFALVLVVGYGAVTWLRNRRMPIRTATGQNLAASAVSLFVVLLATVSFVDRDFPNLPQYAKPFPDRLTSDWYGTPSFIEAADFVRASTDSRSLFAYSVCRPIADELCLPDFRPSALTRRQYLSLNPLFSEDDVDEPTWEDLELSQSIGSGTAAEVIQQLRDRNVDYLLAERKRVSDGWIRSATSSGSTEIFRNSEFVVLDLGSD